jgi:hypothetical protein
MAYSPIDAILKSQEPAVRRAFLEGIASIANQGRIAEIERYLAVGDVDAVIKSLGIEGGVFNNLRAEILKTFGDSGTAVIQGNTWSYPNGKRVAVRFNMLSTRAEEYARTKVGNLIQDIAQEAVDVVRNTVADGYALGRTRNRIATDLIGRLYNGQRIGGVIGLSEQQRAWVSNMRGYLATDPTRALDMTKRDRRFDKLILSSARDGKPLTQAQIDNIARQYADKLLKSRALTIARTETAKAMEEGRYEAWKQALEKTGVPEQFIIRTWVHTGRGVKDRPAHIAHSGRSVRGLNFPFVLNNGAMLLHPHDTSFGAGPENIINCMCQCKYSIDRKGLKAWRG